MVNLITFFLDFKNNIKKYWKWIVGIYIVLTTVLLLIFMNSYKRAKIENGRLTAPVKDINIIGNGPKALSDIVAVGNDLKIDNGTWTCGKEQSVPVSCGMPTILVSSLTVGGE